MTNIYNYLKKFFSTNDSSASEFNINLLLIALMLIAIPLKPIFGSLTIIAFVLFSIIKSKKENFSFGYIFSLPILFYVLMLLSLIWTRDMQLSKSGLQKELPFLFIPVAFMLIPKIDKVTIQKILRLFSLSIVLYSVRFIFIAILRYIETKNQDVFFYHELVSKDVNAIYFSVFTSFALFYFVSQNVKSLLTKASILILSVMVFLLSSKSIITIDIILICCYYAFFSDIPKSVKRITLLTIFGFLIFSFVFVKKVKERFLIEYETAFVDNTENTFIGGNVYNISLKQAWNLKEFAQNQYFPGTALRVYQTRIFVEMVKEQHIFFTGFGLEASQDQIRKKAAEHKLFPGYGDFNFHNQYVQTFSEIGFFGFIILIAMLLINLRKGWANKDFLQIAFAITMIVLFLSESFFCRQRGIVFFIILFCLFNTPKIKKEEELS